MFQRAFHRFHNAVDCSIFGAKKPVVLRALNSKVAHNKERAEQRNWDSYHEGAKDSSSSSSSSSKPCHRCAVAYLIKQLTILSQFPKCMRLDEIEEQKNLTLSKFVHHRFSYPPLLHSQHQLLNQFEYQIEKFPAYSTLLKSSSSTSSSKPFSTFALNDYSIDSNENPILPSISSVETPITSTSAPVVNNNPPVSTFTQGTQTSAELLPSLPESISIHLPEGDYKGQILDGIQHGYGTFVYANGDTYSGNWENGLAHGRGRMIYTHHGMYDGEWKAGRRHGIGLYIPLEDDAYLGEWYDNTRHGYGRQFSSSGQLIYDGQWENNERNGSGIAYFGKSEIYNGQWLNGKMHGHGCWIRGENKEIQWEGEWQNGTNVHGVWHVDSDIIQRTQSGETNSTEKFTLPSISPSHNEEKPHAKVIVVHGVQPQDQIVVQYNH
jgi:hypothetical protein